MDTAPTPRACRVIPFTPRPRVRRNERPAQTMSEQIAAVVLMRWGYPETAANLGALESALRPQIADILMLSATLPRWICSDVGAAIGERIAEA